MTKHTISSLHTHNRESLWSELLVKKCFFLLSSCQLLCLPSFHKGWKESWWWLDSFCLDRVCVCVCVWKRIRLCVRVCVWVRASRSGEQMEAWGPSELMQKLRIPPMGIILVKVLLLMLALPLMMFLMGARPRRWCHGTAPFRNIALSKWPHLCCSYFPATWPSVAAEVLLPYIQSEGRFQQRVSEHTLLLCEV